jgi:hypothetical protein
MFAFSWRNLTKRRAQSTVFFQLRHTIPFIHRTNLAIVPSLETIRRVAK